MIKKECAFAEEQRNLMVDYVNDIEAAMEERADLWNKYKLLQEKDIEYNKMFEYWQDLHRANYVYVPT